MFFTQHPTVKNISQILILGTLLKKGSDVRVYQLWCTYCPCWHGCCLTHVVTALGVWPGLYVLGGQPMQPCAAVVLAGFVSTWPA